MPFIKIIFQNINFCTLSLNLLYFCPKTTLKWPTWSRSLLSSQEKSWTSEIEVLAQRQQKCNPQHTRNNATFNVLWVAFSLLLNQNLCFLSTNSYLLIHWFVTCTSENNTLYVLSMKLSSIFTIAKNNNSSSWA